MKSSNLFIADKNQVHRSLLKYSLECEQIQQCSCFSVGQWMFVQDPEESVPDFLIADLDIGDIYRKGVNGKSEGIGSFLSVLSFSSRDNPLLALKLLESGATDYIVKSPKELTRYQRAGQKHQLPGPRWGIGRNRWWFVTLARMIPWFVFPGDLFFFKFRGLNHGWNLSVPFGALVLFIRAVYADPELAFWSENTAFQILWNTGTFSRESHTAGRVRPRWWSILSCCSNLLRPFDPQPRIRS